MLTREKLLELIHEHGLAQYADAILNASKPAIHISRKRVADDSEIPVGVSKLGGSPDVPEGFVWPKWNEKPLTFIGQFRLSEVTRFDIEHMLPPTGILSFFYAADEQTWGAPDQRGSWKVLYTENESTPLQRVSHPIAPGGDRPVRSLSPCSVEFSQIVTLPVIDETPDQDDYVLFSHGQAQSIKIPKDKIDQYGDLRFEIGKAIAPLHQLLGNPDQVQGDIRYECQFKSSNIEPGSIQPDDPRRAALEQGVKDWRLLLQIVSDDAADGLGIVWGDIGTVYYCMKNDALQRRDFEGCCLTMQSN
ncbi:MAG: YwqG family protein [Aggregatilineales bacterium]